MRPLFAAPGAEAVVADAIGVAVHEPARQLVRIASSTPAAGPIVIDATDLQPGRGQLPDTAELSKRLVSAGLPGDAYATRLYAVAVRRALQDIGAP